MFFERQALHPQFVLGDFRLWRKLDLSESGFSGLWDLQDSSGECSSTGKRFIRNRLDRILGYGENRNLGDNEILKILILTNTRNPKPSTNR